MTPDTWDRRNIPATPGYNNPAPSGPAFTVTYNEAADTLTVTEPSGTVFPTTEQMNYTGAMGAGALMLANGHFTVVDANTLRVDTARTLIGTGNLAQLDFFDGAAALLGIWTGAVDMTAPQAAPFDIAFTFAGWINVNDSSGLGTITPSEIGTAEAHPGVGLQVNYMGALTEADMATIRIATDMGNVDISTATGNMGSTFGNDTGQFIAWDDALTGLVMESVVILDAGGNAISNVYDIAPDHEAYDATLAWGGAGVQTLTVEFNGLTKNGAPNQQLNIGELLANGTYGWTDSYVSTDPEVVEWSNDRIVIQDTQFTDVNKASATLFQLASSNGSFRQYGAQIPDGP